VAQQFYDATTLWEAVEHATYGLKDIDMLLMDLLVYKHPGLAQATLALLTSRNCQRQRLLDNLTCTQLIVDHDAVGRLESGVQLLVGMGVRVYRGMRV